MPSRISRVQIILCFLFALRGLSWAEAEHICRYCMESQLPPASVDLSDERYQYAPDRQVDVLHLKLDVTPDFNKRSVAGTVSITAQPIARPVEVLRLDAVDIKVKAVRADGAEVEDFTSNRNDLRIAFAQAIAPGTEFTVHIEYTAEPQRGLYFRTPEMGYPASDTHLWTQGEAHEARFWFPCFDYPNERSSTEVVCHVPAGMTVLSNGQRMGEETDGNGLKVVRWLQRKPHVSYLICLVAGYFEKLEKQAGDVPLGFYTQPTLAEHAHNSFRDTPEIMEFLAAEIGVPFPWNKYDQVTIRDFTAGGMENTTLTTLTHRTIFTEATENLRTSRQLDTHEMTHQWFGDYVTCKDWSHLWLNEGFATYYTHLFEGHKFGRDAMDYGLYRDAQGIFGNRDDKRPIVFYGYKNAMEQFDFRAYPKGSWVLHMLRCQLGPELYRACIKAYLEKHALSSVISDDLRQVIEQQSGRSMDRFFDQWLYHARHPDFKVTYEWLAKEKLAKLTIRQTQSVNDDVLLFHVPTKLRFWVDGKPVDHEIEIREVEQDFYVPLVRQPTIVRFDPDLTVLADVTFDKSNELLKAQLENPDDMLGRLLACKALGERKTNEAVELLSKALASDPFFGVRMEAAEALAKHDSDAARAALLENRVQADARVRKLVVEKIVSRYRPETPGLINEMLRAEQNPAIVAAAIRGLGAFHGEEEKNSLIKFLASDSFRNELAEAAIAAIRQQNDPSYKKALMRTLRQRESSFSSQGFGQGLETLAHVAKTRAKKADVRDFLSAYVNHPKKSIQTAALTALGTLEDPQAQAVLETFADSSDTAVSRAAKQALDRLRERQPVAPKELIELRKQMAEMQKSSAELRAELKAMRDQRKAQDEVSEQEDKAKTQSSG